MQRSARTLALSLTVLLTLGIASKNVAAPRFEGAVAFRYLEKQCKFGPRVPGSAAHDSCRVWMRTMLASERWQVQEQPFTADNPRGGARFKLTNIVARFGDSFEKPLMLCAHWDSRPVADQERDPLKRVLPIIGANDGASGVAVLLHIAEIAQAHPPKIPLMIVFFDGEDIGREGHPEEYAAGARFWAGHQIPEQPSGAILLDMVGDTDLRFGYERISDRFAPDLRREFWQTAIQAGLTAFVEEPGVAVEDDHVPLIRAGIPAIDIIDFEYPYWHTLSDTPDKCSPESLQEVGQALVEFIYR